MVEPISLGLAAGAAISGIVVGKFSSRKIKSSNNDPIVKKVPLHFIAVADEVEPQILIETAKAGEPVFVNLKPLRTSPHKKTKFLKILNTSVEEAKLELHEVSSELLLITDGIQQMRIRTLTEVDSDSPDRSAIDSAMKAVAGS
jgi:SepF-like predicted cell division protein (DUF552 family)